ncbi:Transposase [Mycolicibacterium fluoranthenivorans]|uniref:Transposase n=1 Tax=Mycolicibacterium fluoranthenivorans TaxID=258505 RepID=A0A1G4WRK1_9MYCO|nr:Transposase [Mycolicibacterium fluoranthenivorans]
MSRPYPAEFRARAIALVRARKPQKKTADDLSIRPVALSKWIKQDDIHGGTRPGVPSRESTELRAARQRIRKLETELAIAGRAATFLREDKPRPRGSAPVINRLVDAGPPLPWAV